MSPRAALAAAWSGLALLVVALDFTPISNNDIFLHLTTGRRILETGRVPRVDEYSATAAGRPYIAHEWLAAVLFRAAERIGGLDALIVLKILVVLATALLLARAAHHLRAPPAATLACLAPVMVLAAARALERPHIFSWLMTAAFLLLLARRRAGRTAPAWLFAALQAIWANLHGGFVLGPVLLLLAAAGALVDARIDRRADSDAEAARLGGIALLLVAASLANPYGFALLRFPFALTRSSFMSRIYEWQPTFDSRFLGTYMARWYVAWTVAGAAAIAAAIGSRIRRGVVLPGGAFPPLLFVAFFALSLRMNRNVTEFALATVPGVAAAIGSIARGSAAGPPAPASRRATVAVPLALAGLFLAAAAWFAARGYPYAPSLRRPFGAGVAGNIPVAAADYLARSGVRGNVFNTYAAGAYLVYRLYPAVRVAMDSRNDVYGEALYTEHLRALEDPAALRAILDRIEARAIVIEWAREGAARTAATVRALGDWVVVHFDDTTVVHLRRTGPLAALAERDGLALLDPALFLPGRIAPADRAATLEETGRAVARHPSFIARVMRADALVAAGRREEGLAMEAALFADDPPLFHIHACLGMIRLVAGDGAGAAVRFRRSLELRPDFGLARDGLRVALEGG